MLTYQIDNKRIITKIEPIYNFILNTLQICLVTDYMLNPNIWSCHTQRVAD